MATIRPDFLDSEYFYIDWTGWHLASNAPEELQKEFREYMKIETKTPENETFMFDLLTITRSYIKRLKNNEAAFDVLTDKYNTLLEKIKSLHLFKLEQTQDSNTSMEYSEKLTNLDTENKELLKRIQQLTEENDLLRNLKYEQTKIIKPSTGNEFGNGRRKNRVTPEIRALIFKRRDEKKKLVEIRQEIKKLWNIELSTSAISRVLNIIDFW